ncbi:MAG: glycosyltransferase [Candidatus Omnitrophica bacterium]|nr:glycosyltransferase [Candidatus Omnitrophota bacterium]
MKILLIHASAGAGHQKAAEAIYTSVKKHTDFNVQLVDALDYTNSFYKKIYRKTYALLISKCPKAWGFFFWLADIRFLLRVVQGLRRFFNAINAQKLHQFLKKENFDYIISTHFFPNEVAAFLKRRGEITSKIICGVTDYDAHSIWVSQGVDRYCVACEHTKKTLVSLGVRSEEILITGIPTDEKFSQEYDRASLCDKLGLKKDIFTVLIATGSFGIGPIEEIIASLSGFQRVVVCGHNKSLFNRLLKTKDDLTKVYGFIDNMNEFMAVSDAMVTKPGGLSISEALVTGLVLIFFSAIPGQETNNIKVLKEYGVGVSGVTILEMAEEIKTLNASLEYRAKAMANIKKLARPSASCDIINLIA